MKTIKIENASWKGTRMNDCKLFINQKEVGTIDHDHRSIILDNIEVDEDSLFEALASFDCEHHSADYDEALKEYKTYSVISVEDEEEE